MSVDIVGDFITVIRNAVMVSKVSVVVPFSKMKFAIAQILKDEGFIVDYLILQSEDEKKQLKLLLKYVYGESPIHEITRVSRLGRRHYAGCNTIKPVSDGLGISILTTNKGVITNKQAKKFGVGGEVICTVW